MADAEITLTIPGDAAYLRLARLAAADVASRAGFNWEEIEDLRIAVDELCYVVVDGAASPLQLAYRVGPGVVEVEGCVAHPDGDGFALADLAETIVRAVVDEHRTEASGGERRFWLRKQVEPGG